MRSTAILLSLFLMTHCTQREFSASFPDDLQFDMEPLDVLAPDTSAFTVLDAFNYPSRYAYVETDLRMHYLDLNPSSEKVIVLLHGEPTWGYTFRHMIPLFLEGDYRVIVPDMIGFGKSDKLAHEKDYTNERHVRWLKALLFGELHLERINLFVHGWGGLIGLRMVGEVPERFATVTASNTGLPTGDEIPNEAFIAWQEKCREYEIFPVSALIQAETRHQLTERELAAFEAPYPSEAYKSGVRSAPHLVPTSPDHPAAEGNRKAWERLREFRRPFLTLYSASDPFSGGWARSLREKIPGARNQPHLYMTDAGHFIEEDNGRDMALHVISFIANASH